MLAAANVGIVNHLSWLIFKQQNKDIDIRRNIIVFA